MVILLFFWSWVDMKQGMLHNRSIPVGYVGVWSTAVQELLAFFFCVQHGLLHREAPGRGLLGIEGRNIG